MHDLVRPPAAKVPVGVVCALGLTQIIGYGTLYYSFSILAPGMAADLGLTLSEVFAIFSAALFIGGLTAGYVGRQLDRFGAASVMAVGSVAAAATLVLAAWSPSVAVFALAIVLSEITSGMVQYQAAFAALVEREPRAAERSITYLTLIAGFASTLFWPLATLMVAYFTWREIFLVFAALNLVLCMPLHGWMALSARRHAARGGERAPRPVVEGALPPGQRRGAMVLVSSGFALVGFVLASLLAHLVPMLGSLGLGASAVVIGALFGPAQVLSRLINMVFGARLAPPALAVIAAIFVVSGVLILLAAGTWLPGAMTFAICLGLGSGITSIAQGSLPLYLFGSQGYGAITGQMAAVRLAVGAAAPFVFAATMERLGLGVALVAIAGFGALGVAAFAVVALSSRPRAGG